MTTPPVLHPLEHLAARDHDLIVVGAGITGCCCALDAARRGLRVALVERDDFAQATSRASSRILHGGLRYLQSLDLPRARESAGARRWFLRHFPDLTRPLRCVLPLYGEGLRRPVPFRAALAANALLTATRNRGMGADHRLGIGTVAPARAAARLHPLARTEGLRGLGVWHDALVLSHARLIMAILRWAASLGALAANHAEAVELRTGRGGVTGLVVRDARTGETCLLRGACVINAAGAWGPHVAESLGAQAPSLHPPALAFNLLLDREPSGSDALGVSAPGGPTWFLLPRAGRLLAGTAHLPLEGFGTCPRPAEVRGMLAGLNAAAPSLALRDSDVLRIDAGVLPGAPSGEPLDRWLVHDHEPHGGPAGLVSVRGVKYTTAPVVAAQAVAAAAGRRPLLARARLRPEPDPALADLPLADPEWPHRADLPSRAGELGAVMAAEGATGLAAFLLARTEWGQDPTRALGLGERLAAALGWDPARRAAELEALERALGTDRPMLADAPPAPEPAAP